MKGHLLPTWQAFTPGQASSCHCMQLPMHPAVTHLSWCRNKPFSPEPASAAQAQCQESSSPWKLPYHHPHTTKHAWCLKRCPCWPPGGELLCRGLRPFCRRSRLSPPIPAGLSRWTSSNHLSSPGLELFVCQQMSKGLSITEQTGKIMPYSLPNTIQNLQNRNSSWRSVEIYFF